jgi:PadR family transcriptional regulator PadR
VEKIVGTTHDLTGFQRDVLVVIAGLEEPHGLAIKSELEGYYESEVNHGRLYPNLDELVGKGVVEKEQTDQRLPPDTDCCRSLPDRPHDCVRSPWNIATAVVMTQRGRRELSARQQWESQSLTG